MDRIIIDNRSKRIEVNDDGDYIVLPFGDQQFPIKFYDLINYFEKEQQNIQKKSSEIDITDMKAVSKLNLEFHKNLKNEVDKLFGENTCKKVFGDIIPAADMYADFFEQLMPFFEKYAKQRQERINNKYSANRQGNV